MTGPVVDNRIPDVVSPSEAAMMLGVTKQAVHGLIQRGQLPARRAGESWVIRRVEVERRRDAELA